MQKRLPHIRVSDLRDLAPQVSARRVEHEAGARIAVGGEDAVGRTVDADRGLGLGLGFMRIFSDDSTVPDFAIPLWLEGSDHAERGFDGQFLTTRSGGGAMTASTAKDAPCLL